MSQHEHAPHAHASHVHAPHTCMCSSHVLRSIPLLLGSVARRDALGSVLLRLTNLDSLGTDGERRDQSLQEVPEPSEVGASDAPGAVHQEDDVRCCLTLTLQGSPHRRSWRTRDRPTLEVSSTTTWLLVYLLSCSLLYLLHQKQELNQKETCVSTTTGQSASLRGHACLGARQGGEPSPCVPADPTPTLSTLSTFCRDQLKVLDSGSGGDGTPAFLLEPFSCLSSLGWSSSFFLFLFPLLFFSWASDAA